MPGKISDKCLDSRIFPANYCTFLQWFLVCVSLGQEPGAHDGFILGDAKESVLVLHRYELMRLTVPV